MSTRKKNPLLSPFERLEDRLAPAGGLDTMFGTTGKVILHFADTDTVRAVAIDSDGRAVTAARGMVGSATSPSRGSPRPENPTPTSGEAFSPTSGKRNAFFGNNSTSGSEYATAVQLQQDGKIVVAGYTNLNGGGPSTANDFAIARFKTDGSLDTSFGTGGKVTVDFSPTGLVSDDRANAVLIQPDGTIVVAGSSEYGGLARFTFIRLNPLDGSLDMTFSSDGKLTVQVGDTSAADFATGLAYQPDGKKIVAVGYTDQNSTRAKPNNFAVVRLTDIGELDGTFGGGKQVVDFGADDRATAVAVQADGKIVIAGSSDGGFSEFALVRLGVNGNLDRMSGVGGKKTVNIGRILVSADFATGLAVQPDGKIVVGGHTRSILATTNNFAAVRLSPTGDLDTTFGVGVQTVDFGADDRAFALARQSDGRVVLAGGNGADFALARLRGEEADLSVTVTNGVAQVIAGSRSRKRSRSATRARTRLCTSGSVAPSPPCSAA